MAWSQETVEARLTRTNSFNAFIENGGFLKLQVCGTGLLFFANTDDTISAYYEMLPHCPESARCALEFCSYAIPYLTNRLSEHRDRTFCSPYCIEPIIIE